MFDAGMSRQSQLLVAVGLMLFAACIGALIPLYIREMGDGVARLIALPAAILLGFLFVFNRKILFLLIIFFRAMCDPVFEATRFGAGAMGLGGIANALVILMAFLFFVERPRAISRTAIPMWGPLMLAALIAALRAPEMGQGAKYFLVYLSYAAVFSIPFHLKECREDMGFAVRFVLLSSILPALYGFVDFARGGGGGELAGRISGAFEHPNIFAFYLVFMVSLVLYLLKSTVLKVSTGQRWLLAVYMAVLLLLLLTRTRSAWAACLVVFAVYGLIFERRVLVYLVVGAGLLLLVPSVQDRLLDLAQGNDQVQFAKLNSYAWRKLIWETGVNWMKPEYLPFGYGMESFRYYSPVFFPLAGNFNHGAHSVYVQWYFEAGIFGVACAAWLFYRLFAMLRPGLARDQLGTVILITIVLEYLVMSYSDNMLAYLSFNWYFWFLMGAACAFNAGARLQDRPAPGALAEPGAGVLPHAAARIAQRRPA